MKTALRFLLMFALAALAAGQTTIKTGATTTVQSSTLTVTDSNPAWVYYWSVTTIAPEIGLPPNVTNMSLYDTATVTGGWVVIDTSTNFPSAYYDTNASNLYGYCDPEKGTMQFTYQYTGTYASGAELATVAGKVGSSGTGDSDDILRVVSRQGAGTVAVRAEYIGANGATATNTPEIAVNSPAVNTSYTVNRFWNRASQRTDVVQYGNDPPAVTGTALAKWKAPVGHRVQLGNDTTNPLAYKANQYRIWNTWTFQMTGDVWEDFNFTTFNQANLEANDHTPWETWTLQGTTTNMTTNTDAFQAMPCLVNNQTSASNKGLKWDINNTQACAAGVTTSAPTNDQPVSVFFWWVNPPTLTNNTSRMFCYFGDGNGGGESYCAFLIAKNESGTHMVRVANGGFSESSGFIPYTPGTTLGFTFLFERAAQTRTRAQTTAGVAVGSEITTATFSNRNANRFSFGTLESGATYPAQSGQFMRFSNFVLNGYTRTTPSAIYPLFPNGPYAY